MRPRSPQGGGAAGLERPLRTGMGALGAPFPSLVGRAVREPVVSERNGPDALVLLASEAHGRSWTRAPRLPVIGAQSDPDS